MLLLVIRQRLPRPLQSRSSFVPNRPNNCTAYDVGEEYERTFLAVEFEELGN
jgi:hypothetical protein